MIGCALERRSTTCYKQYLLLSLSCTFLSGERMGKGLIDGAPAGSVVGMTESGWMTEELFYQWLHHYNASIPPARPVLLIIDNHVSRFSLRIIEYCREQQIHMLLLPPNATHIMQVGDVSIHAPFKQCLREQTGVFLHAHPRTQVTRYHYAQIIAPAYTAAFSPANILAGYKATGIHPYNPPIVTQQLRAPAVSSTSTTPVITLSDILAIPGELDKKQASAKKRATMPFTRILTADAMHKYFTEEQQKKEEATVQKEEKKRQRASKKRSRETEKKQKIATAAKASTSANKRQRKVKQEQEESMPEQSVGTVSGSDDDQDDSDDSNDCGYSVSSSTPNNTATPVSSRPSRIASQAAHIRINLADYSW
jgi:hypothetical protein